MENVNEQFITLKDVFTKIGTYYDEVIKRKKYLLIGALIGLLYFGGKSFFDPIMYHERLTFMMDEASGGKGGMFSELQILGELFGSPKGGNNLGKILQLFESKKIINNTLFDTIKLNNRYDYLANHFIEQYTIKELVKEYNKFGFLGGRPKWCDRLVANPDFRFIHADIEKFNSLENLYLRLIYVKITGDEDIGIPRLLNSELDDMTGIMTLLMKSEHEDLTLGVLNNIYKQLSSFFIEKAVEKQLKTFRIMKMKKDSVLTELKQKEFALADFKDSNRKLVTVKGYLSQLRLERDVEILNIMYGEVVKQLEATDFALRNKTPVVQIIDLPQRPIIAKEPSTTKNSILGFLFGGALAIVIIVIRKFAKDIMNA